MAMDTRVTHRTEENIRALLLKYRPELVYTVGVDIVFHRNRTTMASWSRKGSRGTLRLHQIFRRAPAELLEVLVRHFFTRISPSESRRLRAQIMDFVEQNRVATLCDGSLPRVRPPRGKVYNLDQVRTKITQLYIPERLGDLTGPRMGWSWRATPSLMGKWIEGPPGSRNLIVVNRLLDNDKVPPYYLEYIVYHEILHDLFPIRREAGRWVHHPVEFRRRERRFALYQKARRWEEERLSRLLRES